MTYKRVVVTGSLAYDHILGIPSTFSEQILDEDTDQFSVSYFMKQFDREFGGTAGNIAFNLSLLGLDSLIVATAGKDIDRYMKHLQSLEHVDLSGIKIYSDIMSANGFVMKDTGNSKIWGFYEGAMEKASSQSLLPFLNPDDLLVISANNAIAMVNYINFASDNKCDFVFDPAYTIPHIPSPYLKRACEHAAIVIGNEYEIATLLSRIGWKLQTLLESTHIVITTQGAKGSMISVDNKLTKIKPVTSKSKKIESTGVGDAYRAGFITGLVKGWDIPTCGQVASVAATFALESTGSQTHKYSQDDFTKRYFDQYGETLKL